MLEKIQSVSSAPSVESSDLTGTMSTENVPHSVVSNGDTVGKPVDGLEQSNEVQEPPVIDEKAVSKFIKDWMKLLENKKDMSPSEFVNARKKLVENEKFQKTIEEFLGSPYGGLTKTGRIKLPDGTIMTFSSRQKMFETNKKYWDVLSVRPPQE